MPKADTLSKIQYNTPSFHNSGFCIFCKSLLIFLLHTLLWLRILPKKNRVNGKSVLMCGTFKQNDISLPAMLV